MRLTTLHRVTLRVKSDTYTLHFTGAPTKCHLLEALELRRQFDEAAAEAAAAADPDYYDYCGDEYDPWRYAKFRRLIELAPDECFGAVDVLGTHVGTIQINSNDLITTQE